MASMLSGWLWIKIRSQLSQNCKEFDYPKPCFNIVQRGRLVDHISNIILGLFQANQDPVCVSGGYESLISSIQWQNQPGLGVFRGGVWQPVFTHWMYMHIFLGIHLADSLGNVSALINSSQRRLCCNLKSLWLIWLQLKPALSLSVHWSGRRLRNRHCWIPLPDKGSHPFAGILFLCPHTHAHTHICILLEWMQKDS